MSHVGPPRRTPERRCARRMEESERSGASTAPELVPPAAIRRRSLILPTCHSTASPHMAHGRSISTLQLCSKGRVFRERFSTAATLRRQSAGAALQPRADSSPAARLQLSAAALGPSPCAQPSDEPSSLMSKSTEQVLRILRRLLALERRQRLGSAAHAPSLHVARRERGAHEASRQVFPWRHGCRGCHTPGPISVAGGGAE